MSDNQVHRIGCGFSLYESLADAQTAKAACEAETGFEFEIGR